MILKVLLVLAVIGTVYFIFFKKKPIKSSAPKHKKHTQEESNDMIECNTCGIYSELSDSIQSGSKYYCSSECLEKA